MPDKQTLDPGEFAIQDAATFSFNPAGTSVTITDQGLITITLNYTLDNAATIQRTPGPIKLERTCGVFKTAVGQHFKSGTETGQLSVAAPAGNSQVLLESDSGDIILLTDGEKGRQGVTVSNAKESKTGKA